MRHLRPRAADVPLPLPSPVWYSLYAYGVLDEGYRWDLSVDEAVELGLRSIYHATFRDAASGGTVSGAVGVGVGGNKAVSADEQRFASAACLAGCGAAC